MSRLLSRASRQSFPAAGYEQAALSLFDVAADARRLPVAPFRYFDELGKAPGGYCLNADPVHLRADTHGLLLFDASTLAVSEQERGALAATLGEYFAAEGWTLESGSAQHWYLTGEGAADLATTPTAQVCGRTVDRYLPAGRDAAAWLRRSNEIQMLLHAHPVNRQRAAEGRPAINSLWLWGGGVLPPRGQGRFDRVYGNHPFIRGLGAWHQAQCAPLPADLAALDAGDRVLAVLDDGLLPAAYQDLHAWNAVIGRYERDWFAPAVRALSRRRINHLELLPLDGRRYRVSGAGLWRLWRRARGWREALNRAAA